MTSRRRPCPHHRHRHFLSPNVTYFMPYTVPYTLYVCAPFPSGLIKPAPDTAKSALWLQPSKLCACDRHRAMAGRTRGWPANGGHRSYYYYYYHYCYYYDYYYYITNVGPKLPLMVGSIYEYILNVFREYTAVMYNIYKIICV